MTSFLKQYLLKHWSYFVLGFLCLILTNYLTILISLKVKDVINVFATVTEGDGSLVTMIGSIIGLALGVLVVRTLSRILVFYPGRYVEYELRKDVYHQLMQLPQSFFRRISIGDLMSRMLNDINNIRLMVGLAVLHVVNTFLVYSFVFYQMQLMDLGLMLIVMSPIPIVMLIILRLAKNLYRYTARTQQRLGDLTHFIVEALGGVRIIKSFAAEEGVQQAFEEENLAYERNHLKVCRIRAQMFPFIGIISSLGQFFLFIIGGRMVIERQLTLGEFVAISAYLYMLAWPTAAFAWISHIVQRGRASLKRIQSIMDESPEVQDSPLTDYSLQPSNTVGLEVKNLSFSFEDNGPPILKNVSFQLSPGHSLGIFGTTGSGKSVLAQLLAGVEKAPRDTVFVNGHSIETWPLQSYRKMLSYVPQSSFLFSESIVDNIAFADVEGAVLRDQRSQDMAHLACVDKDINIFPQGYQTLVGEKGVILSGGQRNRIALARALFKPYAFLILDDILSAVDHKTEKELIERLYGHNTEATKVIVSHRVSALMRCEHILVIEHGKVAAQGTHETLIAQPGVYRDTWRYQKMDQESYG